MSAFRDVRRRVATAALVAASVATLVVGVDASTAGADPPSPNNGWFIDADTLTMRNAQEDGFLEDGDTPLMAVIAFRTRLGVPGTTTARIVNPDGVDKLCAEMDQGDRCGIPDATGRANFGNVSRPGEAGLRRGQRPDVIGTVQLTFEDDNSDNSYINRALEVVRAALQRELAAVSERVTGTSLAELASAPEGFKGIGARVMAQVPTPSLWQSIGLCITSLCNPDDQIDYKVTMMLGLDQSLQAQADIGLYVAMQDSGIAAAVLWPRNLTLAHRASGTHWNVDEVVGLASNPTPLVP